MRRSFQVPFVLTLLGLCTALPLMGAPSGLVHHRLTAHLDPASHTVRVVDTLAPPLEDGRAVFVLHAGLGPRVLTPGWSIRPVALEKARGFEGINASTENAGPVPLEAFELRRSRDAAETVDLAYGGLIDHPLRTSGQEYQRAFSATPGIIGLDGVFLSGTSAWVPAFGDGLVTFELTVEDLTPPWDVVSQGARTLHETHEGSRKVTWSCLDPQEEVYLVAGPWYETDDTAGKVALYAFLREDDPALARKYLDATKRYLAMYESILPPYPYPSFALVENFWETGYGMPGFTLLGPKIIRFPWILRSSYPHELLHNWWGNSAYVDFSHGNWCEGLTAYMADHMLAEQRGKGAEYRRNTLKKFTDFVRGGRDFPLSAFGNRSSAASEAVGYGKALMLFHMVRRAVGDEAFLRSLSRFYRDNRFRRASWDDLAAAFEAEAGGSWKPFFHAWVSRKGAPELTVASAAAGEPAAPGEPWTLSLRLEQRGVDRPFPMAVPVAVTVEGRSEPVLAAVGSCERTCELRIPCPGLPLRLDVDPAFDVMRRLDPLEVPPAISTLMGDDRPLFVLPASAPAAERAAWNRLAAAWSRPGQPDTVDDTALEHLPKDRSVWVLGWTNRFAGAILERLAAHGVTGGPEGVTVAGRTVPRAGHSVVLVARGTDPARAAGWIAAAPVDAIAGLARKLPHYTKYSWLAFEGPEPSNTAKGGWQPLASPLVRNLSGGPLPPLELPKRAPLATVPPAFDASRMRRTVEYLASPALEGRGLGSPGLAEATAWVERAMRGAGLEPFGGNGSYRITWRWTGGEPPREMELTDLVGAVRGTDPSLPPVLVTAHLDHLGHGWPDVRSGNEGTVHPGADDNASGVAVLLELARAMAAGPPHPRTVIFAVVTGEEAGLLGSRYLVAHFPGGTLPYACLNLDTVGRLREGKLYVLNTDSAREWKFLWMGVAATTGAPVAIVSEPLDASDQGACLERGIPAVQLFTGPTPDYHRPTDTADKIDAPGMATVAEAAHEALDYLADRREPLTPAGTRAEAPQAHPGGRGRSASLGTMPDFAFDGTGVRVARVMPGSPAERAGLQAGDILVALDGRPLAGLRDLSKALAAHEPGDHVTVTVLRDGKRLALETTLAAR